MQYLVKWRGYEADPEAENWLGVDEMADVGARLVLVFGAAVCARRTAAILGLHAAGGTLPACIWMFCSTCMHTNLVCPWLQCPHVLEEWRRSGSAASAREREALLQEAGLDLDD